MRQPAKYVQPIHYEDFDGLQFERFVFAYHARALEFLHFRLWKTLFAVGRTPWPDCSGNGNSFETTRQFRFTICGNW